VRPAGLPDGAEVHDRVPVRTLVRQPGHPVRRGRGQRRQHLRPDHGHVHHGDNAATGLPWAPATDGLRNITGRVNADGSATIWAITSTVSGNGDQGADPNKLVSITDQPSATSPAAGESFQTVQTAANGQVLRGVSFTPGTGASGH